MTLEQATCDDCGNDELSLTNREMVMEEGEMRYHGKCPECGATGVAVVDEDGTTAEGCVNFEDASWYDEEEQSDDEQEDGTEESEEEQDDPDPDVSEEVESIVDV